MLGCAHSSLSISLNIRPKLKFTKCHALKNFGAIVCLASSKQLQSLLIIGSHLKLVGISQGMHSLALINYLHLHGEERSTCLAETDGQTEHWEESKLKQVLPLLGCICFYPCVYLFCEFQKICRVYLKIKFFNFEQILFHNNYLHYA